MPFWWQHTIYRKEKKKKNEKRKK